jgi:hypothetical protein
VFAEHPDEAERGAHECARHNVEPAIQCVLHGFRFTLAG